MSMKTFLVVMEQHGGCDYTIGCGIRVELVSAESYEALLARIDAQVAKEQDGDDEGAVEALVYYADDREDALAAVRIYEVQDCHFDFAALQDKMAAKAAAAQIADREERERAELARLQAKYK